MLHTPWPVLSSSQRSLVNNVVFCVAQHNVCLSMVQTRSSRRRAEIGTSAADEDDRRNGSTQVGSKATEKQIQQLIDELGAQKSQEVAQTSSHGKCAKLNSKEHVLLVVNAPVHILGACSLRTAGCCGHAKGHTVVRAGSWQIGTRSCCSERELRC